MQHTPNVRRQLPEQALGHEHSGVCYPRNLDRRVARRLAVPKHNNSLARNLFKREELRRVQDASTGGKEVIKALGFGHVRHVIHPSRHDKVIEVRNWVPSM
jgi:hypothetical protein